MRSPAGTIFLHYGGALLFTALAVLVRWLLDPWPGDHLPLVTLYGAVALSVWLGQYQLAFVQFYHRLWPGNAGHQAAHTGAEFQARPASETARAGG
jgi:hypothetical protein